MWNGLNDNDILDFAPLWNALGGPAPESVATAFSIPSTFMGRRHLQRSHMTPQGCVIGHHPILWWSQVTG